MNRRDFIASIRRSYAVVDELQLAQSFSSPQPLAVNESFRDLVLSEESTYLDVYYTASRLSFYNFILKDFSFFQFSMFSEEDYRYAYYPSPHSEKDLRFIADSYGTPTASDLYQYVREGLMDEEEYMSILSSIPTSTSTPLFRYEYRPAHYQEFIHPSSHFHIGFHSNNRWPVRRFLTPLAFSLLILKRYYIDTWNDVGDDPSHEFKNIYTGSLATARQECFLLGTDLFSAKEQRLFFME